MKKEKLQGAKSKEFGCYWKSFFMSTLCYPMKINLKDPEHVIKMKKFKTHFNNISYLLPCKFCSNYTRDVLMKDLPLNFSGRIELMYSLYLWKDRINKKLLLQGCTFTKQSPPFSVIYKRYEKLRAVCDKKLGKCV